MARTKTTKSIDIKIAETEELLAAIQNCSKTRAEIIAFLENL